MNLTIKRFQDEKSYEESFHISSTKAVMLLESFYEIKSKLDSTLTFGAGCRSGVCGSCAVLVNGKEELACGYKYRDGDVIEPLRYHPVLRDLKVDKSKAHSTISQIVQYNYTPNNIQTPNDESKTKIQTDCILCDSCYSACPVMAVNADFLGPFALTRAFRYLTSQGQTLGSAPKVLQAIQTNGIWDCTLCGECTTACPQGIDSKMDIMMLRSEAGKAGYSDPNLADLDFNVPDFLNSF